MMPETKLFINKNVIIVNMVINSIISNLFKNLLK